MNFWFITMRLSGTRFWMDKFDRAQKNYRMVHTKAIYLPLIFEAIESNIPIVTCRRNLRDIQQSYKNRGWDPDIALPEYEIWLELIEPNAVRILNTNDPIGTWDLPTGPIVVFSKEPIGHGV